MAGEDVENDPIRVGRFIWNAEEKVWEDWRPFKDIIPLEFFEGISGVQRRIRLKNENAQDDIPF